MRSLTYLLVAAILSLVSMPLAGRAQSSFLVVGDSISYDFNNDQTDWGALFAQLHPELGFCRDAVVGRTSAQALANVDFAMSYCALRGMRPVETVLVLEGINDDRYPLLRNPEQTARTLRKIAEHAVARGAVPYILTLTPAYSPLFPDGDRYVVQVRKWLKRLNRTEDVTYPIVDLGHTFKKAVWLACAADGVQPYNAEGLPCRQAIATAVDRAVFGGS